MCPAASSLSGVVARRRFVLEGQVQGVGFRPFVYRIARRCRLQGFVRNDIDGVTIEVQGTAVQLGRFARALEKEHPPLVSFHQITAAPISPRNDETGFFIQQSHDRAEQWSTGQVDVTVDIAVCRECLDELFDEHDRRFGYGLINCTNCGPRFSIIRRVPYDRPNTTMARFPMCEDCRRQYADPTDRRFHAQPIACHRCGPKVELVEPTGRRIDGDSITNAAQYLAQGRVLAIKGLGGFHLAARADATAAVAHLRELKHRDYKPFAVMCRSRQSAGKLVALGDQAAELMQSPRCPIVLAPRLAGAGVVKQVAPQTHRLGVMLPYTPIHHLLFAALDSGCDALVMTSGNLTDEPLVIDNHEAVARLGGLCDAMLWHDRPIERCVDDSVVIDMGESAPLPVRRARGYAPSLLPLPRSGDGFLSEGLCVGGELKNTIALVQSQGAVLSQHLGDLKHPLAFDYFKKAVGDLCDLFRNKPQWIAADLHPMYLSTSYARRLARHWRVPLAFVQHHHAHAASVMAEHNQTEPVLAIVCDGVGFGADHTIWGGELLLADLIDFKRLARLQPLRLPGGDAAAKDTRRCALALLYQAFGDQVDQHPASRRLVPDSAERQLITAMIRRNVNCAASSAAGRVFDGVAALLGLCQHNDYEAQAGMALEAAAYEHGPGFEASEPMFQVKDVGGLLQIDLCPLIRRLADHTLPSKATVQRLAAVFHDQLALAWATVAEQLAIETGVRTVALSGGVFCNQRLTEQLTTLLQRRGLRVLRHHVVPPNDGGLSLGQAAIAAARFSRKTDHQLRIANRHLRGALCV